MIENLFYILVGYLPFQIALNPYFDIDLMSGRIFILALFFYWFYQMIKQGSGGLTKAFLKFLNFQSILLLTFLFITLVSLSQAREIFWGIRKILLFCSIFPLYFLTLGILDTSEKIRKALRILVFSSLPIALIGILQFLAQFIFVPGQVTNFWAKWIAPIFYGRAFGWLVAANPSWLIELGEKFYFRAISLFPDPHTFAFYLGLIIPLTLIFLIESGGKRKLFGVIFAIQIISLLLTFSRGGYLAMLATFAFLAIVFVFKSPLAKVSLKYKLLFLGSCLLFAGLIFVPLTPVSQCFYSSFDFSRYSNAQRITIWERALDSIASHPWLGVGIGNFPRVVDPWAKYLSPINAHNAYLDIASEMGIFALWIWLILFSGTIFLLVKQKDPISFGLAGSLIWFSIHAVVETPIYNPTVLAILMIIFGLSTIISTKRWNNI